MVTLDGDLHLSIKILEQFYQFYLFIYLFIKSYFAN